MSANDNSDNIVKLKEKKDPRPKKEKKLVATVFLKERDVGIHFPQADATLILKPRAAYELAFHILSAIKQGADKYLPKE